MFGSDIAILLPEIILSVFAMAGLIAAVYTSKDGMAPVLVWMTAGLLALVGFFIGFTGEGTEVAFDGMFINDGFARFAKVVILLAAAAVGAYAYAPLIADAVPQAGPYLAQYVDQVNELRVWLDGLVQSLADQLAARAGS